MINPNNLFPLFLNDWSEDYVVREWSPDNTPIIQLMSDFQIDNDDLEGVHIIVASYTYESYEGDAFVLFEQDGKLYEVNGGHCSCYGLEGQWSPEEADIKELEHRLTVGSFGKSLGNYNYNKDEYEYDNVFAEELLEVIQYLKSL